MEIENAQGSLALLLEQKADVEERVAMLRRLVQDMQKLKLNEQQATVEYLYYCDTCWETSEVRRELQESYCSHCWNKESVIQLKRR